MVNVNFSLERVGIAFSPMWQSVGTDVEIIRNQFSPKAAQKVGTAVFTEQEIVSEWP